MTEEATERTGTDNCNEMRVIAPKSTKNANDVCVVIALSLSPLRCGCGSECECEYRWEWEWTAPCHLPLAACHSGPWLVLGGSWGQTMSMKGQYAITLDTLDTKREKTVL